VQMTCEAGAARFVMTKSASARQTREARLGRDRTSGAANSHFATFSIMELAGIEPASKDPSIPVSPITVFVLSFPPQRVQRQTHRFSSFMPVTTGSFHPAKLKEERSPSV